MSVATNADGRTKVGIWVGVGNRRKTAKKEGRMKESIGSCKCRDQCFW